MGCGSKCLHVTARPELSSVGVPGALGPRGNVVTRDCNVDECSRRDGWELHTEKS